MNVTLFSKLSGLKDYGSRRVLEAYVTNDYVAMNKWQHYLDTISASISKLRKSHDGEWVLVTNNGKRFLKEFVSSEQLQLNL
jgi:hypothetical protein